MHNSKLIKTRLCVILYSDVETSGLGVEIGIELGVFYESRIQNLGEALHFWHQKRLLNVGGGIIRSQRMNRKKQKSTKEDHDRN